MPNEPIEGYQDHEQDISKQKTRVWYYGKENIDEEYNQEKRADKQPEVQPDIANEEPQQTPQPSFMRQFESQYQGALSRAGLSSYWTEFMRQLHSQYQDALSEGKLSPSWAGFIRQFHTQYQEFVAATCFLTIFPFPGNAQNFFSRGEAEPQLVIGSAYFPLVGLCMAIIGCLLLFIFGPILHVPSLVLAALLTVALVVLTGGLHIDGLMDTCDGIFGGSRRERKLEIMRDSHVGSFAVLGGVSILLLKFAIFASLDLNHLILALCLVLPIARWAMVLAIYLFPSARPRGLGAVARQTVTPVRLLIAAIISLLIALVLGQFSGLLVWMAGSLVALFIGMWATYVLGGLTGDIYGTIAETTEVVCLLMLLVMR